MKKYLYLFIVTIGLSSCSQNLTCEDFKDGEFKIPSSMKKNRVINVIRKGNSQVEIVDGQPTLYYVIKWTDDCAYNLVYDETKMELNDIQKYSNLNGGTTVTKLRIEENCLFYRATFLFDGETQRIDGKICK